MAPGTFVILRPVSINLLIQRRPGATGCDEDFEFSFAFELILGAVDWLHATGWASGDPLPGASR
jgi:hypothetical protein